jgi:hypothetical protein
MSIAWRLMWRDRPQKLSCVADHQLLMNRSYWQAPWPVALHDPVKFEPPPPRGPWISDF